MCSAIEALGGCCRPDPEAEKAQNIGHARWKKAVGASEEPDGSARHRVVGWCWRGGREGAVLFGFRQEFTGLMLTDAQRDGEEGSRSYGRSEAVCYMLKRHEES